MGQKRRQKKTTLFKKEQLFRRAEDTAQHSSPGKALAVGTGWSPKCHLMVLEGSQTCLSFQILLGGILPVGDS
jgi:hypothetical protein